MNLKLVKTYLLSVLCFFMYHLSHAQDWQPENTEWYNPVPPVIVPGEGTQAPSDAIILFDGKDFSKWESQDGNTKEVKWKIKDGAMEVNPGTGGICTKDFFGDCQLHIEWRSPETVEHEGQNRGNSGIFLQSRYELQVLDCYNNPTYVNGQAGSIYKQKAPLVNVCRKPGEWQVYDIFWIAPKFGTDGKMESPAAITVVHNGVLIHHHYELKGNTPYVGLPTYVPHGRLPLALQDHSCPVQYRNIWIRNL